jgi:hypothetical protein
MLSSNSHVQQQTHKLFFIMQGAPTVCVPFYMKTKQLEKTLERPFEFWTKQQYAPYGRKRGKKRSKNKIQVLERIRYVRTTLFALRHNISHRKKLPRHMPMTKRQLGFCFYMSRKIQNDWVDQKEKAYTLYAELVKECKERNATTYRG